MTGGRFKTFLDFVSHIYDVLKLSFWTKVLRHLFNVTSYCNGISQQPLTPFQFLEMYSMSRHSAISLVNTPYPFCNVAIVYRLFSFLANLKMIEGNDNQYTNIDMGEGNENSQQFMPKIVVPIISRLEHAA